MSVTGPLCCTYLAKRTMAESARWVGERETGEERETEPEVYSNPLHAVQRPIAIVDSSYPCGTLFSTTRRTPSWPHPEDGGGVLHHAASVEALFALRAYLDPSRNSSGE